MVRVIVDSKSLGSSPEIGKVKRGSIAIIDPDAQLFDSVRVWEETQWSYRVLIAHESPLSRPLSTMRGKVKTNANKRCETVAVSWRGKIRN